MWDSQSRKTQTHGLVITAHGSCDSGWGHDNDLRGNAVQNSYFWTSPSNGTWYHNQGIQDSPVEEK